MKKLILLTALLFAPFVTQGAEILKTVQMSTRTAPTMQPGTTGYWVFIPSATISNINTATFTVVNSTFTGGDTTILRSTITFTGALQRGTVIDTSTRTLRGALFSGTRTDNSTVTFQAGQYSGTRTDNSTITFVGAALNGTTTENSTNTLVGVVYNGSKTDNSTTTYTATQLFNSSTSIKGTITNNAAAIGYVGEYLSAVAGTVNFIASTQYMDGSTITLTAGDWDLCAQVHMSNNGATWSLSALGISANGGNDSTGLTTGDNRLFGVWANSFTTPISNSLTICGYRVSVAATTPYYLKLTSTYTLGGPPQFQCRLSARRVR